jgi:excisionase family DNA binding protein
MEKEEHRTPDIGRVIEFPRFLNAHEAASKVGLNERTIRRAIHRGSLKATKRGRQFLVDPSDLAHFQAARSPSLSSKLGTGPRLLPHRVQHRLTLPALPGLQTSMIGRQQELEGISALLADPDARIISLTGPGGVGKTRLAIACAGANAASFAQGAGFISLTEIRDPGSVPAGLARALGIAAARAESAEAGLTAQLKDVDGLLVLDNFDQIVTAGQSILRIASACPNLKFLITSRTRLKLSVEREYMVEPLPLPKITRAMTRDKWTASDAVLLFLERTRDYLPPSLLSDAAYASIAEICRRVDGLPLAIELAAARTRALSPGELLARLDPQLPILIRGPEDAPVRHKTMRRAIAWSFDSLDSEHQRILAQLTIFTGGFSLEAANAVVGANSLNNPDLFDAISLLVDASLLQARIGADDRTRYSMLETVREFGSDFLRASALEELVRLNHARYFAELAGRAGPNAMFLPDAQWLIVIAQDHHNLIKAFETACEFGHGDLALRIAAACGPYWIHRGYAREGREWLLRAIQMVDGKPSYDLAVAWHWAGQCALGPAEYEAMIPIGEEELAIAAALGDEHTRASGLHTLALAWLHMGHWNIADDLFEEQLSIWRHLGSTQYVSWVLVLQGGVAYGRNDFARARKLREEALHLFIEAGDERQIAGTQAHLALVALAEKRSREAALLNRDALIGLIKAGDISAAIPPLIGMSAVALEYDLIEAAIEMLGAADGLNARIGARLAIFIRKVHSRVSENLARRIDPRAFEDAHVAGQAFEPEDWIAATEAIVASISSGQAHKIGDLAGQMGITRRMQEVLDLLAQHKTD